MKTLTVTARIERGKILIEAPAPADLAEGDHPAIIQIAETMQPRQQLQVPTAWPWTHESGSSTFGREEIYGDDGR